MLIQWLNVQAQREKVHARLLVLQYSSQYSNELNAKEVEGKLCTLGFRSICVFIGQTLYDYAWRMTIPLQ
jgi:hypothetical protein